MRRGKLRSLALLLVLMMFAAGLAIFLYADFEPYEEKEEAESK